MTLLVYSAVTTYVPIVRKERGLLDPAKRNPHERYCSLGDKLVEVGRYGQKTGASLFPLCVESSSCLQQHRVFIIG